MVDPVYFPKPEIVYPNTIIKDVLKVSSRVAEQGLHGVANTELFKLEVTLENVSKETVKWFELEFEAGTIVQTWNADAEEKPGGTVVRLWPEAVAKEGIPPGGKWSFFGTFDRPTVPTFLALGLVVE